MPNLPTIAINNQAVYDRLVAAFNASPEEYRTWLKRALLQEVLDRERWSLQSQAIQAQEAQAQELRELTETEWPTQSPTPPTP